MPILDAAADANHQQLYRYAQLGLVPDWVRQAKDAFPEKSAAASPRNAFADVRSRQFRLDSPAATYLSALYFTDQQSQYPVKTAGWIRERIESAVKYWGIDNAYQDLRVKLAALHVRDAETLSDDCFALVRTLGNGQVEREYPLRNAKEVRAAAEWLKTHRDHDGLPFGDRYTIAVKIHEKAAQYGASLGEHETFIERQAGLGFCSAQEAADMIRIHVKAAAKASEDTKAGMLKLAQVVETTPELALDHGRLVELAKTVDLFDRSSGLISGYGNLLKRAEDVLFGTLYKEAQAVRDSVCQLTTGSVYDHDQLEKLSVDDIRSLFGEEFADQCTSGAAIDPEKLAELASTLPYPDALTFDRLMSDVGQGPVFKQSGFRLKFNRDELAAAAAVYGQA